MKVNTIYQGDTKEVLTTMPSDFVDTIVTSPPYWGLRDYGVSGQIGLEKTLDEYINKLLNIIQELKRVLKPTGVMFWNHGDCYGGNQGRGEGIGNLRGERISQKAPMAKCLYLQNYRLILKMIDQGWILRNSIVWHKPNAMPSSVKDRFSNSYEPVFMLVKNKKYWFDLDSVRIPHRTDEGRPPGVVRKRVFNYRVRDAEKKAKMCPQFKASKKEIERYKKTQDEKYLDHFRQKGSGGHFDYGGLDSPEGKHNYPTGKNPGDVWRTPTQPFPEAHFATFPEKLIEPMILSSCPEWICSKCGKARIRITKTQRENENSKRAWEKGTMRNFKGERWIVTGHQTIGWTKCNCNAEFKSGIILDPFMGAGTVGMVAKKLRRNYIGIELNPDYIKIAEKRILNTQKNLL